MALATYSLAQVLGGCIGITTATTRHSSSSILRRLGGSSLESGGDELPSYYDPQFQCQMEVLGFDSDRPAPKYGGLVDRLRSEIRAAPVICAGVPRLPWPRGLEPGSRSMPAQVLGAVDSLLHV
jgi:hypothetical protein